MTPAEIKQLRLAANQTQTQAAELIGSTLSGWQKWESGVYSMHAGLIELYQLKTGQHPEYTLVKK